MANPKFNEGDLVWAQRRGYGIVLETGHKKEEPEHDIVGACDYAIIQWQNKNRPSARIFRGSIGWERTEVRSMTNNG